MAAPLLIPDRNAHDIIRAEVTGFSEIPEIQQEPEPVSKPFDHANLEKLPFHKLIGEAVIDTNFVQVEDSNEERDEEAIQAMKILFKCLKGDKTVESVLKSATESKETLKEVSEAAALLMFMGYETIYLATESSLLSLYNNIPKIRKSVEAKRQNT